MKTQGASEAFARRFPALNIPYGFRVQQLSVHRGCARKVRRHRIDVQRLEWINVYVGGGVQVENVNITFYFAKKT